MISSITLSNFKSYRRAELPLAPLSLLIGANASGKSNAIEAIRLLYWISGVPRLDFLLEGRAGTEAPARGIFQSLAPMAYGDGDTFGVGCRTDWRDPGGSGTWDRFAIELQVAPWGLRVVGETIEGPDSPVPLYTVATPAEGAGEELQVQYHNFARGGRRPKIPCSDRQPVLAQLDTPTRFGRDHTLAQRVIPRVVEQYRQLLGNIFFLEPDPRRMRQPAAGGEGEIHGDGSNLSAVLYDLCHDKGQKEEVLEFVRALPEREIRDLSFAETSGGILPRLTETFAGEERGWDITLLSDGILRVLAVAAAVLSAPEGALVVIEGIDNSVHPRRACVLLENLHRVARGRKIHVLLATHNPAFLDALPLAAIPEVVSCYRDPRQGDSRLVRLGDLEGYPELVARGPLGRLMNQGILERFLKRPRSAEQRKEQALRWISSL